MRTIKELLQITLNEGNLNFEKGVNDDLLYYNGFIGLCGFVAHLRDLQIITTNELNSLEKFINDNRPKPNSPHYSKKQKLMCYYWKNGQWNPRKKWLMFHINNIQE